MKVGERSLFAIEWLEERDEAYAVGSTVPALRKLREGRGTHSCAGVGKIKGRATCPQLSKTTKAGAAAGCWNSAETKAGPAPGLARRELPLMPLTKTGCPPTHQVIRRYPGVPFWPLFGPPPPKPPAPNFPFWTKFVVYPAGM